MFSLPTLSGKRTPFSPWAVIFCKRYFDDGLLLDEGTNVDGNRAVEWKVYSTYHSIDYAYGNRIVHLSISRASVMPRFEDQPPAGS